MEHLRDEQQAVLTNRWWEIGLQLNGQQIWSTEVLRNNRLQNTEQATVSFDDNSDQVQEETASFAGVRRRRPFHPSLGRNITGSTSQFRPYRPHSDFRQQPENSHTATRGQPSRSYKDIRNGTFW